MDELSAEVLSSLERAALSAELLFNARGGEEPEDVYEPEDRSTARAAVTRLGEMFDQLPGKVAEALEGAADHAGSLSTDPLQGLSEIIQNADDVEASEVRFTLQRNSLWAAHDGLPVRLSHVIGLATPWLTTKAGDERATGRFGIGLMTLRSLSPTLDVHCEPYHLRIGEPTITAIDPCTQPPKLAADHWTVLRAPLAPGLLKIQALRAWFDLWDDTALFFLRHVRKVTLVTSSGRADRELSIRWDHEGRVMGNVGGRDVEVIHRRAHTPDGRTWTVHLAEAPAPTAGRRRKASGATTPIGVALARRAGDEGHLYAGLPVVPTSVPVRANAQFDPLANRQGLDTTAWNDALLGLIADVWSVAILDLFRDAPKATWAAIPTGQSEEGGPDGASEDPLAELLLLRARKDVARLLQFRTADVGDFPLAQLAVESSPLEGILTEEEVASVAGLPAALPRGVRDGRGHWRRVLADWRAAGVEIPRVVQILDALPLLEDQDRDSESTIALTAAALDAGLALHLDNRPCLVLADGERIPPPGASSALVLTTALAPLAEQLGVARRLHSVHMVDSSAATRVMQWLTERGVLIEGTDAHGVLRRLADAGRGGRHLSRPLTMDQVSMLRQAFEQLEPSIRMELGIDVGRAILLQGYQYSDGEEVPVPVKPGAAYLPRSIDRDPESFAVAAGTAPGLMWLDKRYDRLTSSLGPTGLGAQRFLRLLGAETAPRIRRHPRTQDRYASGPPGVPAWIAGEPSERLEVLQGHGATFTLQDHDSPDLAAVVQDIARERAARTRRRRAAALLAALSRGWDRLGDFAEVRSAFDQGGWHDRGTVRGYWLYEAGDAPWLDDASGRQCHPGELRVNTPATVAVYGPHAAYLHRDLGAASRRSVLAALGVTGEPTSQELVERLRNLRDEPPSSDPDQDTPSVDTESVVVYRALAERLGGSPRDPGSLTREQLRRAFTQGKGLVFAGGSWHRPSEVFAGPPIFGGRRTFLPVASGTESLWQALRVERPTATDCVSVLTDIARAKHQPTVDDQAVILEALRLLTALIDSGPAERALTQRLAKLPLWTSKGWMRERPVYSTDDPLLEAGVGQRVPVWTPGGEIEQFQSLLPLLRVRQLASADTEVVAPGNAAEDARATSLLQAAVPFLADDLQRNDPAACEALVVSWSTLEAFEVKVDPALSVRLNGLDGAAKRPVIAISAKADLKAGVLFVSDPDLVPIADAGGRAIASLFTANHRQVAQAWRSAFDRAESETLDARLVLARQRAEEQAKLTDAELEARSAAFAQERTERRGKKPSTPPTPRPPAGSGSATPPAKPRTLVDPANLRLRGGEIVTSGEKKASPPPGKPKADGLPKPRPGGATPRERSSAKGYTELTKESVGLDLVRQALACDKDEMIDLRAQHGVGADAVDDLGRFYELKVYAGAEPDQVTLQDSQVARALSDPNFFLVIVSELEGPSAEPRVRVILHPLSQLKPVETGSSVRLSGVRESHSILYEFEAVEEL